MKAARRVVVDACVFITTLGIEDRQPENVTREALRAAACLEALRALISANTVIVFDKRLRKEMKIDRRQSKPVRHDVPWSHAVTGLRLLAEASKAKRTVLVDSPSSAHIRQALNRRFPTGKASTPESNAARKALLKDIHVLALATELDCRVISVDHKLLSYTRQLNHDRLNRTLWGEPCDGGGFLRDDCLNWAHKGLPDDARFRVDNQTYE